MKFRAPFDVTFLRKLLRYNPKTGLWKWHATGLNAGTVGKNKRRYIGINRQQYLASRLAVLYMTGCWPICHVDHKNGNPEDERWNNIREASYNQNAWNKRGWSSKKKLKGAFRRGDKWRAIIGLQRKNIYLGTFESEREAHVAYRRASKKYHGEFGRQQ